MITKTFNFIRDAYGCSVSCPICGVPLFTSLAKKYNWNSNSFNDLNMFIGGYELLQNINVDTLGEDFRLIFNVNSGTIIEFSITQRSNNYTTYAVGCINPLISYGSLNYNRLYYVHDGYVQFRHNVCCDNCDQYGYVLNLNIDLNNPHFVVPTCMESEIVTITNTNNDDIIEIENDYISQKTNYTLLSNNTSKNQKLPIVSTDLMKPHDVLNRIQDLLIFS